MRRIRLHRRGWSYCLLLVGLTAVPVLGQTPAAETRYAVLVGVQDYQHTDLPKLRFSENDVIALGRLLRASGYKVTLLCDSAGAEDPTLAPTAANITARINEVLEGARKGDTVLLAFAGHGIKFDRDESGQPLSESYFCPSDARPFPNRRETLVSMDQVYRDLEQSFAGVKVLFVDACRNDPKISRGIRSGLTGDAGPQPPKGVAALFSCEAGQVAYEHEAYQHGAFFYYVLEGLRGKAQNRDGAVTFASLADYVSREVALDVPRVVGKEAVQSPNMRANLSGPSPVLLLPGMATSEFSASPLARDLKELERHYLSRGTTLDFLQGAGATRLSAWKSAATDGDAVGQYLYARLLQTGIAVTTDQVEGYRWMQRAADQELPIAQANLGVCFQHGDGVTQNAAEAVKWYRRAADAGYPPALVMLGECHHFAIGIPRDAEMAVSLYRRAADQNSARGMYRLAGCLQAGNGCPRDEEGAFYWYQRASNLGYAEAHNEVGLCLENGRGCERDVAAANTYYRRGADAGDEWAQNNLGWNLLMGIGTTKDQAAAVPWFRKSAAQGNMRAQTSLGWCLQNGFGVQRDDAAAVPWLKKAAEQGFPRAQGLLANCYEKGRGVTANRSEAIRWYRLAAAQGDQESRQSLQRLGAQ